MTVSPDPTSRRTAGRVARRTLLTLGFALAAPALAAPSLAQEPVQVGSEPGQTLRSRGGMVVSEYPLASRAGAEVLAAGGNAVDAAIATGFALAVTHPSAGNIGGGGFMVIRFPDGTSTALDFREKAPLAASPTMFLDDDGEYSSRIHHNSYLSVGVPGTVAGFDKVHRLYGRMNWERLVYPSVALAEDGFPLSENLARSLTSFAQRTSSDASREAFGKAGGEPWAVGDTFRQPALGTTLERIMRNRRDGFYRGETARLLVEEMQRGGGIITQEDLERYQAQERQPIQGTYRGYDIISMPPPSSGGVAIVEMLNILEGYDIESMGHNTARNIHVLAEAMRRAFRDRAEYMADVDKVDVPVHRLVSKAHAAELRDGIEPRKATPSAPSDIVQSHESPQTTHYSVVDADGMAVSVTYTLEQGYGSGITVAGGGFLLNNEMGDFNAGPGITTESGLIGTPPNLARPEQRMLSSMSPSILARDGELVAVVGSPGGRTIINTVFQVIVNLIDHHMPLPEAVAAGRIHHQWLPDRIVAEEGILSDATVESLEAMGHTVVSRGHQGLAHSIFIDPSTGERIGQPDPRNPDAAAAGTGG